MYHSSRTVNIRNVRFLLSSSISVTSEFVILLTSQFPITTSRMSDTEDGYDLAE